jgi:hypothetical protein
VRFLLVGSIYVAATALAGLLLLAWLTIEDRPWIPTTNNDVSAQQLQQLKQLAKQGLRQGNQPFALSTSAEVLNTGCHVLQHAYPPIHCQFELQPDRLLLTSSIKLPGNPFGSYLSWQLQLPAAAERLQIDRLQIGQLQLPGSLLEASLPWLAATLLGSNGPETLLTTVRLRQIEPQRLELLITPQQQWRQQLATMIEQLRLFGTTTSSLDRQLISHYYQQLLEQSAQLSPKQWISVTYFIAPLLRQLQQQAPPDSYHLHGRAAIMALALYLGSPRFEQILGEILTPQQRLKRRHYRTLLRGRIDLRQHFLVSAALQVLAEQGLSQALGEFKELLDSQPGGSGFSFADLAADRAGTLFARHLTSTPEQAAQLLARLDQPLREPDLMINIERLPEGLSEQRFQSLYQHLDSKPYQALVSQIDGRLEALRLYQH